MPYAAFFAAFILSGKTWGIIGLGTIGRKVAGIASAFGCKVQYYSTSGRNSTDDYKRVSFEELLATSDIVSIHAPLNEQTEGLINAAALKQMKKTAVLINVGRGPIIVEKDLLEAIQNGTIAGAGLDVLSVEPMSKQSPFYGVNDSRLYITPHIAWASIEARTRLMDIIADQIREFITQ